MKPILAHAVAEVFAKGGPVMWPMAVCLFMALFVVLDRTLWWLGCWRALRPAHLQAVFEAVEHGHFEHARSLVRNTKDPTLRTVEKGLLRADVAMLGAMQLQATAELEEAEARQWILSLLITLAPLLGLLGTVTGIMRSFQFVGAEELAASRVSGGIAEALIATACGLGIAIACLIPHNLFNRRFSRLRSHLERTINGFEVCVQSARSRGHDLESFARSNPETPVALPGPVPVPKPVSIV